MILMTRNYREREYRDDMKKLVTKTGGEQKP